MLEEFFQQGDMERTQGLPVSPLMDRTTTAFAPSQINFIEFVVAPLFLQVRLWECAGTATQWLLQGFSMLRAFSIAPCQAQRRRGA